MLGYITSILFSWIERESMKLVYTLQDIATISHLKNALDHSGIRCIIKNEFLRGAVGEVPPIECWPELWVIDDALHAEADKIIKELIVFTPIGKAWVCSQCGEEIEGQFTACWQCTTTTV